MKNIGVVLILMGLVAMVGCKSEYTKRVEEGLASGQVHDSLIFGMKMGQTKKDFFRICWDLNKAQLISEGPGNMSAKYVEPIDSTKDMTLRKQMFFYGIFDKNDVMYGMDMTFSYTSYAPWNLKTSSDSLAVEMMSNYMKEYGGNNFIEMELEMEERKAFVKVDANRQILIYPTNDLEVVVKIEDLRYKFKQKGE